MRYPATEVFNARLSPALCSPAWPWRRCSEQGFGLQGPQRPFQPEDSAILSAAMEGQPEHSSPAPPRRPGRASGAEVGRRGRSRSRPRMAAAASPARELTQNPLQKTWEPYDNGLPAGHSAQRGGERGGRRARAGPARTAARSGGLGPCCSGRGGGWGRF